MSARSDKSNFYCHSSVFTSLTQTNPLHDVHDHPAQGDLQRPQVRVDREQLDNLEVAGDHAGPKETLRDEIGIIGVPFLQTQDAAFLSIQTSFIMYLMTAELKSHHSFLLSTRLRQQ